jgi:hypothetical protein
MTRHQIRRGTLRLLPCAWLPSASSWLSVALALRAKAAPVKAPMYDESDLSQCLLGQVQSFHVRLQRQDLRNFAEHDLASTCPSGGALRPDKSAFVCTARSYVKVRHGTEVEFVVT